MIAFGQHRPHDRHDDFGVWEIMAKPPQEPVLIDDGRDDKYDKDGKDYLWWRLSVRSSLRPLVVQDGSGIDWKANLADLASLPQRMVIVSDESCFMETILSPRVPFAH